MKGKVDILPVNSSRGYFLVMKQRSPAMECSTITIHIIITLIDKTFPVVLLKTGKISMIILRQNTM